MPNTPDQREIFRPSTIEETAIQVAKQVQFAFNVCNRLDHHPPIGLVGRSLSSIDAGSCRGTIQTTQKAPLASRNPECVQLGLDGNWQVPGGAGERLQ